MAGAARYQADMAGSVLDARPDAVRDQQHLMGDVPVTYQPFKFESRRLRIDWRLLHGVDISKLIRDTDLDTLERLVSCVTWGDIEAEDTRHLSEGNFVKVFRLAQLLLEYLLYVQDNLKYTNGVLEKSRSRSVLHMQTLSSRCRELHSQLKQCKKELRRARKTVQTLEIMATAVGGGAAPAAAAAASATAVQGPGVNVVVQNAGQEHQQQQLQQQAGRMAGGGWTAVQPAGGVVGMTAAELLLQSQISDLTERLAVAGCEAQRLREEREELQYQVRYLHDTIAARTDGIKSSQRNFSPGRGATLAPRGGAGSPWQQKEASASAAATVDAGALAAAQQLQQELQQRLDQQQESQQQLLAEVTKLGSQVQQLQTENKGLRKQLDERTNVDFSATNEVTSALQGELKEKIVELLKLQDKLRQSETSMAVFKQANETLKQQYDELQKQLNSPQAVTPSFLKKQRNSMVAAEATAAKTQALVEHLKSENLNLAKQVSVLQAQLSPGQKLQQQKQEQQLSEENAIAAAEELLAAKGVRSSAQQQQQQGDWKLAEIERLQEENRLLQQKVESLQAQVHDLERLNTQLDRQAAKARALGLAVSLESGGRSPSPAKEGAAFAGWGGGSVHSSGPREEPTAADLATGMAGRTGASGAASPGEEEDQDMEPITISVKPASGHRQVNGDSSLVKTLLKKFGGKAAVSDDTAESGSPGQKIAAFRPEQQQEGTDSFHFAAAAAGALQAVQSTAAGSQAAQPTSEGTAASTSSNPALTARFGASGGGGVGGALSREAVQQLKAWTAEMAVLPGEQLATDYGEACNDWDKPFDLNPDEKQVFGSMLPLEMPGRPGLLLTQPQNQQELAANRGRLLANINRQLDAQLATYGIHPGRVGLSTPEFMAAMKMLRERRESWAAKLSPELQNQVDIMRVGLMLHAYNTQQAVLLQQPTGRDGKQHLPGAVGPVLVSEVQPPPSMLPAGPPAIRTGTGLDLLGEAIQRGAVGNADDPGSPLKSAQCIAGPLHAAAASHVTSRTASYTTATYHAKGSASGRSSPELTQAVITKAISTGGYSPMSAALHAKQQLGQLSPGSAAAAAGLDSAVAGGSVHSNASQESSFSPGPFTATSRFAPQAGGAAASASSVPQVVPKAVSSMKGVQQVVQQQDVAVVAPTTAAGVAMKEYLNTSFNDSDEF